MGRGSSNVGKQSKKFGIKLGKKSGNKSKLKNPGILKAAREGYRRGADAGRNVEDVTQE